MKQTLLDSFFSYCDDDDIFVYHGQPRDQIPQDVKVIRVDYKVKVIPNITFIFLEHLESVRLPPGLIEIGDGAFLSCKKLSRINIPSGHSKNVKN